MTDHDLEQMLDRLAALEARVQQLEATRAAQDKFFMGISALKAPEQLLRTALTAAGPATFDSRDLRAMLDTAKLRAPAGSVVRIIERLERLGIVTDVVKGTGRVRTVMRYRSLEPMP